MLAIVRAMVVAMMMAVMMTFVHLLVLRPGVVLLITRIVLDWRARFICRCYPEYSSILFIPVLDFVTEFTYMSFPSYSCRDIAKMIRRGYCFRDFPP